MTTPAQPTTSYGTYLSLPIDTDPDDLAQQAIDYLTANMPGWVAREGHLEVWLLRAFARMCASSAQVAAKVPRSIYQYFGASLVGVTPLQGAAAQASATITVMDSAGYTIPAGTMVGYRVSNSSTLVFTVAADVVIPQGQTQTPVGAVQLVAADLGDDYNALPPAQVYLITNLAFVSQVVTTSPTSGGVDTEDQDAYLNRLTSDLQLLSPTPILPADYAALARNQAGVARACAINGYNPANGSLGNARMITVAAIDAAGNALAAPAAQQLATYLASMREVNFVVNVMSPTYTVVNVFAQVTARAGYTVSQVTAACNAALAAMLSPANWGGTLDANGNPTGAWLNLPTVRLLAVGSVLAQVPGVAYVTGIQMSSGSGGLASTDVQLPGAVPLPTPGSINVVTSPATS